MTSKDAETKMRREYIKNCWFLDSWEFCDVIYIKIKPITHQLKHKFAFGYEGFRVCLIPTDHDGYTNISESWVSD